jgi:hypothetical protein
MPAIYSQEQVSQFLAHIDIPAPFRLENDPAREGTYRFLTTGEPEVFRATGARFLQLPIAAVEHVELAELTRVAA